MKFEEVLQKIDELIAYHEAFSMFESTNYHKGAFDALEELRDAIKQKGGKEMKIDQYVALGFNEAAALDGFWEKCVEHLKHAREKHPQFAKRVLWRKPECADFYARYHKQNIEDRGYPLEDILLSETYEFLAEAHAGNRERMVEEAADIVAVLLRFIVGDMGRGV